MRLNCIWNDLLEEFSRDQLAAQQNIVQYPQNTSTKTTQHNKSTHPAAVLEIDQEHEDHDQACDESADGHSGDAALGQLLVVVTPRTFGDILDRAAPVCMQCGAVWCSGWC